MLALLPSLLIWVPLARYLDAGLGLGVWPVQAFLLAQLIVFAAAAIFPADWTPRLPAWITTAVAVSLCLAGGWIGSGFDAQHPQPSNVFYALDADRHAAYWVTRQDTLDPGRRRFWDRRGNGKRSGKSLR